MYQLPIMAPSVQVILQADVASAPPQDVALWLAELSQTDARWRREAWSAYAGKLVPAQRVNLTLHVLPKMEVVETELIIDAGLFQQIALIYARWGWPCVTEMLGQLNACVPPHPALAELVRGACELLRNRIAIELAAIEADLSASAARSWQATMTNLKQLRAKLQWNNFGPPHNSTYTFVDRQTWTKVNALLADFHTLNRKRRASEDRRKRAAGAPGPGGRESRDLYAQRAREAAVQEEQYASDAAKKLTELCKVCPAVALCVESSADLYDPVRGKSDQPALYNSVVLTHSDRELALCQLIVQAIDASVEQLDKLRQSLLRDGVAELAAKRGGLSPLTASSDERASAERVVARRCLTRWTAGSAFKKVVAGEVSAEFAALAFVLEPKLNTVLGMRDLVRDYALRDRGAGGATRWRACVAIHYLHALDPELEAVRREDEKYQRVVTVVSWVASVTAVVAFVASVFASGGATAAAEGPLICAILEGADSFASAVVLALTVLDLVVRADDARERWRQAVMILALTDAATLRDVSTALSSMSSMQWIIGEQLLQILIQHSGAKLVDQLSVRLGISNKAQLARRAVELKWLAEDLEAVAEGLTQGFTHAEAAQ